MKIIFEDQNQLFVVAVTLDSFFFSTVTLDFERFFFNKTKKKPMT